jgi:predicted house-cleaning noncanonical NTP pyrophosphatase (MazG superfamily)
MDIVETENKEVIYKKLVRDNIPSIIEKSGKSYEARIAAKEEHYKLLEKKLHEEVAEFIEDKNLEELADIMEVVYGLAKSLGYSEEELNHKRNVKREERGAFDCGIVLERVYENRK